MNAIHVILGILGTLSLFMVNSVTQAQVNRILIGSALLLYTFISCQIDGDSGYAGGCMEARGARIWIFVGYVLGFAAIIAAIWVMVADFNSAGEITISNTTTWKQYQFVKLLETDAKTSNWPGVSLLLQNVCIFVASLVYKFGRAENAY